MSTFWCVVLLVAASALHAQCQSDGDLRLKGSAEQWEGRVEVYHNNSWGTVCDDYWDMREANVVCKQLGFASAVVAFSVSMFGQGTGPIWLDNLRCVGNETKLKDCPSNGWGSHNCNHREDAAVACLHDAPDVPKTPGNCNFDNGMCGYIQATDDDFEWTLFQNKTPSWNTGPTHDHTTGRGHYIFIETSTPREQGDEARIESPIIKSGGCVKFYYHMKGETIAELNIYTDDGQDLNQVWHAVGEVGQDWKQGNIPITKTPFKLVFEGVAGTQHTGDIAIDDITILPDACTILPTDAKPVPVNLKNISNYVRLVGANVSSAGRIEVLHEGRWGTVCGAHFHLAAARVVCRQLGYMDVESLVPCCSIFPPGKGFIWLDTVHCEGREAALSMCPHRGWGASRCTHTQDVGVICRTKDTLKDVRLAGTQNPWDGRVEVKIAGIWGTVNDMGFDTFDATVVCRQLGFHGATGAYSNAYYGKGSGPVWISQAKCLGNETALRYCNVTQHQFQMDPNWHWPWWRYPFTHDRDAGVECYSLRLAGGASANEGRVEVKVGGVWGTICNDQWDINDARVVCRQLGFGTALSLKPSATPKVTMGTSPIWTRLRCKGSESALGLCSYQPLLGVVHTCTHDTDAMLVCGNPLPTAKPTLGPLYCSADCPSQSCYNNDKHGGICICAKSSSGCDATVGDNVIDVVFDNSVMEVVSKSDYFVEAVASQLNQFCRSHGCTFQSTSAQTFEKNDVLIMTDFPKQFEGNLLMRFVVLDPNKYSHKVFSSDTIHTMINQEKKLAGFSVKSIGGASPKASASTGGNSTVKVVVPIVVLIVVIGVGIVVFLMIKKRSSLFGTSENPATQRYLHLSRDAGEHDDPLLNMEDEDPHA